MYTYMEYLQKCFYKATNWPEDNVFPNITSSSQRILDFTVPSGAKLDISSKASDHLASSFTLSNYSVINGSLAYLYSSLPLSNTFGTSNIPLQLAISGVEALGSRNLNSTRNFNGARNFNGTRNLLLYGRMYFPGSALETMVIKQLSAHTQLLIKSISNPNLAKSGTMIVYFQTNTRKYSREFVYSTNEGLMGFRYLYNFGTSLPNDSQVSIGTELWYAAMTMSPGLSTAFRYTTKSASTGKPLTITLACNPILGHLSSTYTIKTSMASSFSSKYDFNLYSYSSNLSLGLEVYNYTNRIDQRPEQEQLQELEQLQEIEKESIKPVPVIKAFQDLVQVTDFSSVIKISTSLSDKMVKLLWEGRCKDFLVSAGARINVNNNQPEISKFGISVAYAA